jgi:hypothetical protein
VYYSGAVEEPQVHGHGFTSIGRTVLLIQLAVALLVLPMLVLSCRSITEPTAVESTKSAFEILTGSIGYPNNMYFPAKIRVEIVLSAQNRFTNEKRFLVTQTIRNPQRFPMNFIIRYAQEDILFSDTHSITVQVFQEGSSNPYLQSQPIEVSLSIKPVKAAIIELEVVRPVNEKFIAAPIEAQPVQ